MVRQEFGDQMVFVRGQTLQHIFQISVGVVPIDVVADAKLRHPANS